MPGRWGEGVINTVADFHGDELVLVICRSNKIVVSCDPTGNADTADNAGLHGDDFMVVV